jgi:hypothetical protein
MALTLGEFKLLFPEFSASTYDSRITTLLNYLPPLNAERAGNQLDLAHGYWVAGRLASQDTTMQFGSASASASGSTTTEKKVGDVSIKRAVSQSSSSGSGGGSSSRPGQNKYDVEYAALVRRFGQGAVAV